MLCPYTFYANKEADFILWRQTVKMKLRMFKSKKGVVDQLMPVIISLVAIGVTLAVGFLILSTVKTNSKVAADANATLGVAQTVSAMSDIPGWLPIIIITIIGALLIGLVSMFRGR